MGKYNLAFDVLENRGQFEKLADFMRSNPGSYDINKHEAWIEETCIPGLESGDRRALAWWQNGQIIGDAVLKIAGPNTVELKNFRVVAPGELMDKGMGSMLLKFAFSEGISLLDEQGSLTSEANDARMVLDATSGTPVINFFERHGFSSDGFSELYVPGVQEVLMSKSLALN